MTTIYECHRVNKEKHCENTEAEAIKWLEKNGGGIYKNLLHGFKFYVPPK